MVDFLELQNVFWENFSQLKDCKCSSRWMNNVRRKLPFIFLTYQLSKDLPMKKDIIFHQNFSQFSWPLCSASHRHQSSIFTPVLCFSIGLHSREMISAINWIDSWFDYKMQFYIIVLSCSHFKWIFKGYFLNHLNKFCCISTKFLLEILGNIFTDDFAKVIFWVILSSNPPQRCLSTTQYNISPPGIRPQNQKTHISFSSAGWFLAFEQIEGRLKNSVKLKAKLKVLIV